MVGLPVGQCQDARAVAGTVGDREDVTDPNICRERHFGVDHAPTQRITAVGEYEHFLAAQAVAVGDNRRGRTGRDATGSTVHHHDDSV